MFDGFKFSYEGIDNRLKEIFQQIIQQSLDIRRDSINMSTRIKLLENTIATKIIEEQILAIVNGNSVPTLVAGSYYRFYKAADNYVSFVLKNNKTDILYDKAKAVSTVYYIYVTEMGLYGCGTFATLTPTRSDSLRGFYSSDGTKRLLVRFATDSSGNVKPSSILSLTEKLIAEVFMTTAAATYTFTGLNILKDGNLYDFQIYPILNMGYGSYYLKLYCDDGSGTINDTDSYYNTFDQALNPYTMPILWANGGASYAGTLYVHGVVTFFNTKYVFDAISTGCGQTLTAYSYLMFGGHEPTGSSSNITKLQVKTTNGSLGVASDFRIYKRF